jgi:hypothetical protein
MSSNSWIVTWLEPGQQSKLGSQLMPTSMKKAFDTKEEARDYAKRLPAAYRSSIQLHFPGGSPIISFADIDRM